MKLSAILEPLISAGVPGDVILATVRAFEEQQGSAVEKGREKARARWHKWNDKRLQTLADVSNALVRAEDSSSKKDISGKKEEKKESAASPRGVNEFRAELSPILDAERIDALIAVRRKKGAVLSAHAGRILSKALLECPDVSAAADEMVLRNWTGIKPDWLAKRTTGPPQKPMNAVQANIARRIKRSEPSSGRRDYPDVELLPADQPGLPTAVRDLGQAMRWPDGQGNH